MKQRFDRNLLFSFYCCRHSSCCRSHCPSNACYSLSTPWCWSLNSSTQRSSRWWISSRRISTSTQNGQKTWAAPQSCSHALWRSSSGEALSPAFFSHTNSTHRSSCMEMRHASHTCTAYRPSSPVIGFPPCPSRKACQSFKRYRTAGLSK